MKPDMSGVEPTQAQAEQRVRFKQAVKYSKSVLADLETRAIYESASEQKGVPAFALRVADFLNLPSIDEVDLSAYQRQVGNPITIIASDDFGVVNVQVKLTNPQGVTIENGDAIEYSTDTGNWIYTTTAAVPAGAVVGIQVIAKDRQVV